MSKITDRFTIHIENQFNKRYVSTCSYEIIRIGGGSKKETEKLSNMFKNRLIDKGFNSKVYEYMPGEFNISTKITSDSMYKIFKMIYKNIKTEIIKERNNKRKK